MHVYRDYKVHISKYVHNFTKTDSIDVTADYPSNASFTKSMKSYDVTFDNSHSTFHYI